MVLSYWSMEDSALGNSLFVAVKLIKHVDPYTYKYSGCDIGLDANGGLLFSNDSSFGKNFITFGTGIWFFGANL